MFFPFSLRSSIFISSKQPRSTDVREEKLFPHNTSMASSTLKFLEAGKVLSNPSYFVIVGFTNSKLDCIFYQDIFKSKKKKKENTSTADLMLFFFSFNF